MFVFEKCDWNSILPYGNIYIYINGACNIPRNYVFINELFLLKKGEFFNRIVAYITVVINKQTLESKKYIVGSKGKTLTSVYIWPHQDVQCHWNGKGDTKKSKCTDILPYIKNFFHVFWKKYIITTGRILRNR